MNNILLGAIAGDVCGSYYEWHRTKNEKSIDLFRKDATFTDDTIGTIATAHALMEDIPFAESYQYWFRRYNAKGCGKLFRKWVWDDNYKPYGSFGNGSAMRVSPVGYVAENTEQCLNFAKASAECTHNHPEGIKGAQCVAKFIYNSLHDSPTLIDDFKYELFTGWYSEFHPRTLDEIRPNYHFDSSCQGSVPVAVLAFIESKNYEDCITKAIAMGGDADTLAAMAGSIAYAYYGKMSVRLSEFVLAKLPDEFKEVITKFDKFVNK